MPNDPEATCYCKVLKFRWIVEVPGSPRVWTFSSKTMSGIGTNLLPMFIGQSLISGRVADDRCKGLVVADGGPWMPWNSWTSMAMNWWVRLVCLVKLAWFVFWRFSGLLTVLCTILANAFENRERMWMPAQRVQAKFKTTGPYST